MSSPYVRAMQTAEIFAAALEYPKQKIRRTDLLLPGSEASLFFRELAKDKHSSTIFCFGHAPQLDDLIAAGLGLEAPCHGTEKSRDRAAGAEARFSAERPAGLARYAEVAAQRPANSPSN